MKYPLSLKALTPLALLFLCAPNQGKAQERLTVSRLAGVLECLQNQFRSVEYRPPSLDNHDYKVRYLYGKFSPEDEADELHIIVYGPNEERAILYEVYLGTYVGMESSSFGDGATLKTEKGHLVTDEIPGGQGTLLRIQKLIHLISAQPAIAIPNAAVKQSAMVCIIAP